MLAYMLACSLVSSMRGTGGGYDPDAAAYIAAVELSKGSPMSSTQSDAINDFIVAEKAASRWATHKRIFLHVWANAAANSICMKSLATGTMVNAPTQSAGFIVGNGSTQYFNMGSDPATLGMTTASGGWGWLALAGIGGGGATHMGCQNAGSQLILSQWFGATGVRFGYNDTGTGLISQGANLDTFNLGIVTCQRQGGQRRINRRGALGTAILASNTSADSGTIPTVNIYLMGFNNNGTPSITSVFQYGSSFLNGGFSAADDIGFTLNLKTLWETVTGLILPA